jgi:hypothetical protein
MAKTETEAQNAGRPDSANLQLYDVIGSQILQALGEPKGFRGVNVRRLWEHHYRANVLVGSDVVSATVAHSYFVIADAVGKIVTSTPAITRQY